MPCGPKGDNSLAITWISPLTENEPGFNLAKFRTAGGASALASTGGNKTKTAALLGITREGLRKKLLKYKKKMKQNCLKRV